MRTSAEITAEMDSIQDQFPDLKKLTSSSQLSFFRLLKNMWVLMVMAIEQRTDSATAAVTLALAETLVGSLAWYVKLVKAFQFGDSVAVYDGAKIAYAIINPDKQIVKQATVTEGTDGRLLVKVAKTQGSALGPLNADQLTALKEYIRQVKYAGVAVDVISLSADELKLFVTVKVDPLVLNATGNLLTDLTKLPVQDAILAYLKALPFDSKLAWNALTDALQVTPGVLDFNISRTFIRAAGVSAWTEFTRETESRAGHMTLNLAESAIVYV